MMARAEKAVNRCLVRTKRSGKVLKPEVPRMRPSLPRILCPFVTIEDKTPKFRRKADDDFETKDR